MNIEIISGSPRQESLTGRLALHLHHLFEHQHQINAGLINMQDVRLPFIETVWNDMQEVPSPYTSVARRVFDADAFVLVTPEYNGSYSPALKNFLDHFPKQDRKVFGIVSGSPGSLGGIRAALQLQQLVLSLSGIPIPRMLIVPGLDRKFNSQGDLTDKHFAPAVDAFTTDFLWLAKRLHADSDASGRLVA